MNQHGMDINCTKLIFFYVLMVMRLDSKKNTF